MICIDIDGDHNDKPVEQPPLPPAPPDPSPNTSHLSKDETPLSLEGEDDSKKNQTK